MCVLNDVIYWGDSPQDLAEKHGIKPEECKSVTFIASRLEDNKILMQSDPSYLSNLKAMTEVDMERLLYGNWKKIFRNSRSRTKQTEMNWWLTTGERMQPLI